MVQHALAASGRPDDLVADWLQLPEDASVPEADLWSVPPCLRVFDRKMVSLLMQVCATAKGGAADFYVGLQRSIESATRQGKSVTSVYILRQIYRFCATNRSLSSAHTARDLLLLEYRGIEHIHSFRNNFLTLANEVGAGMSDEQLADLLINALEANHGNGPCPELQPDCRTFHAMKGDWSERYQFLLEAMEHAIDRHRAKENQVVRNRAMKVTLRGSTGKQMAVAEAEPKQGKKEKAAPKKGGAQGSAPKETAKPKPSPKASTNKQPTDKAKQKEPPRTEEQKQKEKELMDRRDEAGRGPCVWMHTDVGCRKDKACTYSHTMHLTEEEKKMAEAISKRLGRSRSASRNRSAKSAEQ